MKPREYPCPQWVDTAGEQGPALVGEGADKGTEVGMPILVLGSYPSPKPVPKPGLSELVTQQP